MVNAQRRDQLKNYGIWRGGLIEKIPEINQDILKNLKTQQHLEKYIKQLIYWQDFSKEFLDALMYKLEKVTGMNIPEKMGIYEMIYSLIVNKVLLPNYTDEWITDDAINEIRSIVESTNKAIDRKLWKMMEWFYYLWIWNLTSYKSVIDILMDIDDEPNFHIWYFFGMNRLWYENNDQDVITLEIPIRTGKKIRPWAENQESEEIIDSQIIKTNLEKLLSIKIDQTHKWVPWFEEYGIKVKKGLVDKEGKYGRDNDDIYTVLTLHTNKSLNLSSLSFDDFINLLEWLFDCNNYIINHLAKLKWNIQDFNKAYHQMWVWTLISKEIWSEELSKEEKEKFNKLLVKDERKTYLSDVWWQQKAKEEISKIILAIKHEEIMRSWWAKTTSGIVFEWPTWTGKTLLARAIATEVDAETYNIKITDLLNSAYINEWAINVRNMFKYLKWRAKSRKWKIIVILDELDALFVKRNGRESGEDRKVVNTFLSELSWFDDFQNVIFIGTTNLYQELDEAIVRAGRFSSRVKVDLPNSQDRAEVFEVHIKKAKTTSHKASEAFNGIDLQALSAITEWFSWADIEEVIRRVVENRAIQEVEWKKNPHKIWFDEISQIIQRYKKEKLKDHSLFKNIPELIEKLSDKETWYIYREVIQWVLNMKIQEELIKNIKKWSFTLMQLIEMLWVKEEKKIWF